MKLINLFIICLITLIASCAFPTRSYAIENPLNVPNNKMGIHILFPDELKQAADLVNSKGGEWGYVTMTIQAGDKNREKWQAFMDEAKRNRLIPIIRLSTEGDYFNTKVWRKPHDLDIIDFANFLNSLDWPVKNKYVMVFNEVNRADEWGGSLNPAEYANILSFAVTVFKSKSPDFFIISAGLDNAAPNQSNQYMNQYNYLRAMNAAVPGIFNQIDGLSSHSYPNPGFSQPPDIQSTMGTGSFLHEKQLISQMSQKNLPIFITETGWSTQEITDLQAAAYYVLTLNSIWNDKNVVAVTPFLLHAVGEPFQKFSFLTTDKKPTKQYEAIKNYPKTRGKPGKPSKILGVQTPPKIKSSPQLRDFSKHRTKERIIAPSRGLKDVFKFLLKI